MCRKTRDLRRQLRKAVVDHVSDSFLETSTPLIALIEAAKTGNEKRLHEPKEIFEKHAEKLVEVANLVCSMSGNEDGVKMVRYAASQIERLRPQVINAARILVARPNSKPAQDNMEAHRQSWENQVRILTEAVDDITTIDDFLAVSENHILEDVNKCVMALQERDAHDLRMTAGAIQGRSQRVCNVVEAEMDNYEPCVYTKRVMEAVKILRDQVMAKFAQRVDVAVAALSAAPGSGGAREVDENDFIDASRLVYDGVREIRRAVLMNRVSWNKKYGWLIVGRVALILASSFVHIYSPNNTSNSTKPIHKCQQQQQNHTSLNKNSDKCIRTKRIWTRKTLSSMSTTRLKRVASVSCVFHYDICINPSCFLYLFLFHFLRHSLFRVRIV